MTRRGSTPTEGVGGDPGAAAQPAAAQPAADMGQPRSMPLRRPPLTLSLQFSREPGTSAHRAVLPRAKVERWLRAATGRAAEFTVRIVGADEGRRLNRDYRAKDYPTNVLTFDYEREPVVVADLVLCAPVVEREAGEQGLTLEAHYAHLLVHGALHAQGHDHQRAGEARAMEALETRILAALGYPDPYRGPA